MRILGIETSCDETSVAVLEASPKALTLIEHVTASQIRTHAKYGGVVPEVAARKHAEVIQPLLQEAVGREGMNDIDLIAVTQGPGLITSLMVGVQTAKTLSYELKKPLIGVNHLEGHIYGNWLTHPELPKAETNYFPAMVLIVSGGHTLFILMHSYGSYTLLGQTRDDAAGESFDKVAKLLKLGYPGGPIISKLAKTGDPNAVDLPRPMIATPDLDVSFSGLKTAVLYYLEKKKTVHQSEIPDIAASFQKAVVDLLKAKLKRALDQHEVRSIMLAGGVSANETLQDACRELGKEYSLPFFAPQPEFTGDNAAMIATVGYYRRAEASTESWKTLQANAQLRFV